MIPKIIHLCWLSNDPFPIDIQKCMDSWKKHLPEYEIWLWDTKRFDINSVRWTKEAYEKKKYAFAADYIRLYALYNYGGIYLDSDVFMYKSFNDLLQLPYFIGQDYEHCFEAAVIGAKKGTKWIGEILEYYDNRSFIKKDETLDNLPLPRIFLSTLQSRYRFIRLHRFTKYEHNEKDFYIFDRDFFNSRNSCQPRRTKKSYCCHNYAGSWTECDNSIKGKIKKRIPKWFLNIYLTISHHTFNRKRIHLYEPKIYKEIW